MIGQIIKQLSNDYTVKTKDKEYLCKPRGKFRNTKETPLVGDMVEFDSELLVIEQILPRKNSLIRPVVANVDQAIIVTSTKEPDFSSNLLDKMLVNIESHHIIPIICFTKLDLLDKKSLKEISKILKYYSKIGYKVITNKNKFKLKRIIRKKVSVLSGQTGAGKSSLLNMLNKELKLDTAPISKALNRGIHTTRHVELMEVCGGLVADTPGFSSLDFDDIEKKEMKNYFVEFQNYMCPFKDCNHTNEKVCAVKQAVKDGKILQSRYENYLKFIK